MYTRSFLVIFCSSSNTRDIDVGKSDFQRASNAINFSYWWPNPFALTRSDGKEFATYHRLDGRRWAIRSQQGYTKGSLYGSSHSFLANSSALLALKQKAGMEVGPPFDSKRVVGPSAIVLISAPIHMYRCNSSPHRLNVCYRKGKLAYCRKNEPNNFPRLHLYCSCKVKSLNESPAGLKHLVKLVAILWVKLVFARVTHCELINNN